MHTQPNGQPDKWQAEIDGSVRELTFDELKESILTGLLQPADRIRRGDLRWLDAGRVPALAGYFAIAAKRSAAGPAPALAHSEVAGPEILATTPQAPGAQFPAIIKSVFVVLLLSLAFTYIWMYYRESVDRSEASVIPTAPKPESIQELESVYERRKRSLMDLASENEAALVRLVTDPPRPLGLATGNMDMCYRIKYSPDLPVGHPDTYGRAPVEIGRELDEECAKRQNELQLRYSTIRENEINQKREGLLRRKRDLADSLKELETDTEGERTRLNTRFYNLPAQGLFYWAFIPIFLFLTMMNVFRLFLLKKLAEPFSR